MTAATDHDPPALLHRLHLAGVRFTWRESRPVASGPLTVADVDLLRRHRRGVRKLLIDAEHIARWEPGPPPRPLIDSGDLPTQRQRATLLRLARRHGYPKLEPRPGERIRGDPGTWRTFC